MTENSGFQLRAHFLSERRYVSATPDGFGWEVETESGKTEVRSIEQAIQVARQQMGQFLRQIDRKPGWGLRVVAGPVAASYGDPDPQTLGVPAGGRIDPNELVVRIRNRWEDGDSPLAALENAIQIIKAYTSSPRRHAA